MNCVRFVSVLTVSLLACGDSSGSGAGAAGGGGSDSGGAGGAAESGGGGAESGSGGAGGAASSGGGGAGTGGACFDPGPLEFAPAMGNPECLTFEAASALCGFSSGNEVCDFAVACGITSDVGQCQINCEQGSSSFCNSPTMVDCLIASVCAQDCDALAACGVIL